MVGPGCCIDSDGQVSSWSVQGVALAVKDKYPYGESTAVTDKYP